MTNFVINTDAASPAEAIRASEIRLIGHSDLLYWWPVWVFGYLISLISYLQGQPIAQLPGAVTYVHPSNNPALLFIAVIIFVIIFTNAKLRGIYSIATLVSIGFVTVLFAWLGWWDNIFEFLPQLSAKANTGFYFVFSTALLIVWLSSVLVFDRLTFWSVRPGQIVEQRLVGGAEHSYDTQGLVFEKRDQDFFRHLLLGFGAGDLKIVSSGARKETLEIPNVLFVDRKLMRAQQLIAITPDQAPARAQPAGV